MWTNRRTLPSCSGSMTHFPSLGKAFNMIYSTGMHSGEGAHETLSVFKGASRRDRRSSKTLEADRLAEAYLAGLALEETGGQQGGNEAVTTATIAGMSSGVGGGGTQAGMASLMFLSGPAAAVVAPGTLMARSMLVDSEYLGLFIDMCRCLFWGCVKG